MLIITYRFIFFAKINIKKEKNYKKLFLHFILKKIIHKD